MAPLNSSDIMLEIVTRGLNQYHRLEKFPVRIGRALDNDIILSDATISGHHLEIDRTEDGSLQICNLSGENGSRLGRQSLAENDCVTVELSGQPVRLTLGNQRTHLLHSAMPVGQTSVRNYGGFYNLLCHPVWAIGLFVLAIAVFLFDIHLQTIYENDLFYYISRVSPQILGIIAFSLLLAGVSYLSTQRWEIGAAVSLVTLYLLSPYFFGELGHKLNYFFTAVWPSAILSVLSNFMVLPALLYAYIRLVHHADKMPALGLALLISMPMLVFQASELVDQIVIANEFTGEANFSRELSSMDLRLAPTLSIDSFIDSVSSDLAEPATQQSPVAD